MRAPEIPARLGLKRIGGKSALWLLLSLNNQEIDRWDC